MNNFRKQLSTLFGLKLKFAATSIVATVTDYVLYLLFVNYFFQPIVANIAAYSIAVVVNFFMQKRFVFALQRKTSTAFALSMAVSAGGLGLSTLLVWLFNKNEFLSNYQFLVKLLATGLVFFYNFYAKRFAFEKRLFHATGQEEEIVDAPG